MYWVPLSIFFWWLLLLCFLYGLYRVEIRYSKVSGIDKYINGDIMVAKLNV